VKKIIIEVMFAGVGLFAAFWGGQLVGENRGFEAGQLDGEDKIVVYCNISPDFCKAQLDRMAQRPVKPALYNTLIGRRP
jgi:hypothetical protein